MDMGQQPSGRDRFKSAVGWLAFGCWSLATTVEVFLHESRSFGQRYLGLQAGAGVLCILVFPVLLPDRDVRPLLDFLLVYLFMCGVARFRVQWRLRRGGADGHSFYSGRPRIMRFVGRMSEETVKRVVEPVIVCLVAVFMMPASEMLGGYLLLAGSALFLTVNIHADIQRVRSMDLQDALLDQRHLVERFRSMRRD